VSSEELGVSNQGDKLFYRETCLADDCPQRAAIEFFVIGNGGLRGRRLANRYDVTATLSIDFKAILPSIFTYCAPEMTGSLLTQRPLPTRRDRQVRAGRARVALPRAARSRRERS